MSTFLLTLTLLLPDWIEAVFAVDPDQHSGSTEWAIVILFLACAISSAVFAVLEWRRPEQALQAQSTSPPKS